MPQNAAETITVTFRRNGDLTIDDEGKDIVVAHYQRLKSVLEFTEKRWSSQLYNQCVSAICTVNKGKDPSGLTIREVTVKGEARVDRAKLPKRPALGPKGDAAADYANWFLEHDLEQFKIRYRCCLDEKGGLIRKHCRRLIIETVDLRTTDNEDLPWVNMKGKGLGSRERSPVFREGDIIDEPNGIVAHRATDITFLPTEVVGGYKPNDDFEEAPAHVSDKEEGGEE